MRQEKDVERIAELGKKKDEERQLQEEVNQPSQWDAARRKQEVNSGTQSTLKTKMVLGARLTSRTPELIVSTFIFHHPATCSSIKMGEIANSRESRPY